MSVSFPRSPAPRLSALSPAAPLLRVVLLGAAIGLALAGCGRRGPLEPPPGAANAQPDTVNQQVDDVGEGPKPLMPSIKPVGGAKGKPIQPPKDSFFLDPIL